MEAWIYRRVVSGDNVLEDMCCDQMHIRRMIVPVLLGDKVEIWFPLGACMKDCDPVNMKAKKIELPDEVFNGMAFLGGSGRTTCVEIYPEED